MRRSELWRSPSSLRDRMILLVSSQTLIDQGVTMLYGVEADADDPGPLLLVVPVRVDGEQRWLPTGGEEPPRLRWIKSTRSGSGGGNCVEVAGLADGRRAVRDSKYPNGPALIFTSGAWTAFAAAVKADSFDH